MSQSATRMQRKTIRQIAEEQIGGDHLAPDIPLSKLGTGDEEPSTIEVGDDFTEPPDAAEELASNHPLGLGFRAPALPMDENGIILPGHPSQYSPRPDDVPDLDMGADTPIPVPAGGYQPPSGRMGPPAEPGQAAGGHGGDGYSAGAHGAGAHGEDGAAHAADPGAATPEAASPEAASPEAASPEAASLAAGAGMAQDPDEADPLPEFRPNGDPLYDALMAALWHARSDKRDRINAELRTLREQQMLLAASIRSKEELERMKLAGAGQQGGGGGLLAGIGALGSAIASRIAGDPAKKHMWALMDISQQISDKMAYRKIVLDRKYVRTMESAGVMMMSQNVLRKNVERLNSTLMSRPEGADFVARVRAVADSRNDSVAQVWDAIHSHTVSDPDIAGLRATAATLADDPVIGLHLRQVELASKTFISSSEQFRTGLAQATEKYGVEVEGLNEALVNQMGDIDCPDAALARPGGERVDRMSKRFKETMEQMMESIRAILETVKSMFRPSSP